jgi:hypothetical protein
MFFSYFFMKIRFFWQKPAMGSMAVSRQLIIFHIKYVCYSDDPGRKRVILRYHY